MGIKNAVIRAASKAGDAVAKVSKLSPEQLRDVRKKREEYLSQMPSADDAAARELTSRLLAASSVELSNSYLAQIRQLYTPLEKSAEYGSDFDQAHNIRYINITKWVVDPDENSLEKLVNVYAVLSSEECNIALVFHRRMDATEVYLAVADTRNSNNNTRADLFMARALGALRGNFPGSEWAETVGCGALPCMRHSTESSVATVSNIPAEKSEQFRSQTVERLLDGVIPCSPEQEYTLILLASPIYDVELRKLRLSELYSGLFPYSSWSTGFQFDDLDSTMAMANVGVNVGASAGVQNGQNASTTATDSASLNESASQSDSASQGVTDSESESITAGMRAGVDLGPISASGSVSKGTTTGTSVSNTVGRTVTNSLGRAVSSSLAKSAGTFASTSLGANVGANFARSSSVTATVGKHESINQNFMNHSVKHALEKLDEQMKRLEQSSALGLWDFAAYVVSNDHSVANSVAHTYLALTQGKDSYLSSAAVNLWRGDQDDSSGLAREICGYLKELRHPVFGLDPAIVEAAPIFNVYPSAVTATTGLSGKELAYALNFPAKSVAGLPVVECASFGRSVTTFSGRRREGASVRLGNIFHMHKEENVAVDLSTNSLASHVFVTGSTGSGKSNTVYHLLGQAVEADLGFLVIEPAKGEYKDALGGLEGVNVFGTNSAIAPLLKVNPFSFPEEIHVLEHLDRLVEVFNACWPMYAAMPAVLKDAMERSYSDCGWDLASSTNAYGPNLFPTFKDVARNIRDVINASEYDAENKGAYKGSLLTRLRSLANGINGMVLSDDEISAEVLFDSRTVVDLSRVGSSETKSLIMGILVLKLQEHRMANASGANATLRHLTVLEEAHNLLRRVDGVQSQEVGNLAGKSVEMLTNAIAEMRTYGEGFVIVDQAPGLLDMAAIRNTNTKIIMRLPDQGDRELVGRAAGLNDSQIKEISRLPLGVAAVYQNEWVEPVLCRVCKADLPAGGYTYEPAAAAEPSTSASDRAAVLEAVCGCEPLATEAELRLVRSAMGRLRLGASTYVGLLEIVTSPPRELNMVKAAPLISELLPEPRKALAESRKLTSDACEWTRAMEASITAVAGADVTDRTRRICMQALATDYFYNELGDLDVFAEWKNNGGLR